MLPIVSVLLLLVVLLLVIYLTKILFHHSVLLYYGHKVPGPPSENVLYGNMRPLMDTQENVFHVMKTWGQEHSPIFKYWIGHLISVNIANPEDAGLVLSDVKHNKKSFVYNVFHQWLQTGLLTSSGEKWVQRRKILTPSFHFTILQDFLEVFNERTTDLVERLKEETDKPHTEINGLVTNCTLRLITETAMGRKVEFVSSKEKMYESALHGLGVIMVHRIFRPYLLFQWVYMLTWNFFKELKFVRIMHNYTQEVITDREKNFLNSSSGTKKKRLALLDLLLTKKTEGVIDDIGIREEVDTFMFEGHDTISAAINFSFMLIASHPQIQEEIVQEMREVLGDITKIPSYEELQELRYMDRCIKEVLRLYPSVPFISRILGEDLVTTSGYKLKKNTIISIFLYAIHHNPELYPDPEKFDPDRFLPENCTDRHPYAYVPFSAGPRNCIGQKFAMLELKAILCGVLGNFILEPVDTPDTIILTLDVVLRTKEKIKIRTLRRRYWIKTNEILENVILHSWVKWDSDFAHSYL